MPKKPRGSPRRKTESPLHVRVKVNPRAVGVGGADLLLFVSLENRGADEIRDVVIEWDLPSGFVQAPEKGESPPHVTPRGRRTAPMDRLEGRKPPKGLTASRALSADGAVAFHRILPQATVHGVVVLRPVRVGRFTARVESITFVDAAGEKQVVSPDASATFSVEEPVAPQIQVAARSARDAALGEPLPVDIRIENAGNMPARGLTLNFKLPDGLRLAESGANEVHLGPIDVEGHRHRIVHIALLPQAPGDVTIDSARVSFQGSAEAITVPAFTLRLEVRVDPARVFVGRDRHREKLAKLLESVALPSEEASSRLVLVAGRAGIGKSRLVEEIKTRARLGGYLVADARCGPTVTDGPGVLPALITSLLDLGQLLRGPVPDQEAIDRHLH
ncbi:MAG: ATP-binding protein, partial [Armatimonadetes bacterium]|nr:ATP-binding protein [Armatimonadota bacterium]